VNRTIKTGHANVSANVSGAGKNRREADDSTEGRSYAMVGAILGIIIILWLPVILIGIVIISVAIGFLSAIYEERTEEYIRKHTGYRKKNGE